MKYARRTALYNKAANPRPTTKAIAFCRGCGAKKRADRCAKCGGTSWEHVPARSEIPCAE